MSDESGLTLVELLVYIVLLGVVMSIVGSLYATTLRTESQIRATSEAVRSAQLVSDSVTTGIRNSSRFFVTTPRPGDQLLMAKVASAQGDAITWPCRAWYYSASTATIRTTEIAAPFTAPTAEPSWPILATRVSLAPRTTAVFAGGGAQLDLTYSVAAAGSQPVIITTSAVSRIGTSGASPCS